MVRDSGPGDKARKKIACPYLEDRTEVTNLREEIPSNDCCDGSGFAGSGALIHPSTLLIIKSRHLSFPPLGDEVFPAIQRDFGPGAGGVAAGTTIKPPKAPGKPLISPGPKGRNG